MPYWEHREFLGRGSANWPAFFRALLSDRTEDGKPFTWFDPDPLWTLETHLLWTPMRTGHHAIDAGYVGNLSIRRAVSLRRWLRRQREHEAEALQKAHEEARRNHSSRR